MPTSPLLRHTPAIPAVFMSAALLVTACGSDTAGQTADLLANPSGSALPEASIEQSPLDADVMIASPAAAGEQAARTGVAPNPRTGRMIGTRRFDNTLLGVDLGTGRFRTLDGNPELAGLGVARDDASVATRRDRGVASGTVLTVDDCLEDFEDITCVLFTDREGNIGDFFSIETEFPSPAKTSFDGEYVVVNLSDRAAGLSVVTIYTRAGDFVDSHAQSGSMIRQGAYDFLPDGRLVYSIEGNELLGDAQPTGFIITDPFDATPQRRIRLPDFYQGGRIKTIESSPDGSEVLINVEPRVGSTRPILVNLDTLAITQLIDREADFPFDAKSVVWGPDGRWVYVVASTSKLLSGTAIDNSGGGTVVFIGSFESLYAYEVNGVTHPMPVDADDLSDSVRLIPTDNPRRPGGEVGGGEYDGNLVWIP